MDPERARIPEDDSKAGPAAKWVVACQIPRWVEKGNYAKFQTYLDLYHSLLGNLCPLLSPGRGLEQGRWAGAVLPLRTGWPGF